MGEKKIKIKYLTSLKLSEENAMKPVGGGGGEGRPTEIIHCSQSQKEQDEEIWRLVDHQEENVKKENVTTVGKSKEQVSTLDFTVKIGG
jgi:hypothetical protein